MKCPFNYEVGDPPEIARCRLGFPGCHCADAVVIASMEPPDADGMSDWPPDVFEIMKWWSENT